MPAHLHGSPQCMGDYGHVCPTHPRLCAHASCKSGGSLLLCEEILIGKHKGKFLCGHGVGSELSDALSHEEWIELSSWSTEMQALAKRTQAKGKEAANNNDSVDPRVVDPMGRQPKTFEDALQRFRPKHYDGPVGPSIGRAYDLIGKFVQREGRGKFPRVDRMEVARGLLHRVKKPEAIDQAQGNVCAPASFMYALARQDPAVYVKYVTDLYDDGVAYVGNPFLITPSLDFKTAEVPGHMNAADWIALGGLRDSANWFYSYLDDGSESSRGSSSPGEIADWFRDFGFREVVNKTNRVFCADRENLELADSYFRRNYRVILRVCANFIQASTRAEQEKAKAGGRGDHRIALASPIRFSPYIQFKFFTWGQIMPIPFRMTASEFLNSYYGFAAARR